MEFKGTKGEWQAYETPDYHSPFSSRIEVGAKSNGTGWVCKIQTNGVIEREEGEANAKLIAAAPELLEALQEVTQMISYYKLSIDHESCMELAESAINKALNN